MIQMKVSQENRIDLLRAISRCVHIADELTGRFRHAVATPAVNHDQVFTGIHQKGVEGGRHAFGIDFLLCQQLANRVG